MGWLRCLLMGSCRCVKCPHCGGCNDSSRALRARLLVAVMQSAWIGLQVWELLAR